MVQNSHESRRNGHVAVPVLHRTAVPDVPVWPVYPNTLHRLTEQNQWPAYLGL